MTTGTYSEQVCKVDWRCEKSRWSEKKSKSTRREGERESRATVAQLFQARPQGYLYVSELQGQAVGYEQK